MAETHNTYRTQRTALVQKTAKLATALSELETCRITIFSVAETLGDDDRASFEAALAHVAAVYEEALARGERAMERERLTFDKTLGAFATEGSRA